MAHRANAVEQNLIEWVQFRAQPPDIELHCDADAVWTFSRSGFEQNQVCAARFTAENADRRIDEIISDYRQHRRGANWWIGPSTEPHDLSGRLRSQGLSCRRHAPGLAMGPCVTETSLVEPRGVEVEVVEDFSVFEVFGHPSLGPISTALRAARLENQVTLSGIQPRRVWYLVASLAEQPVGIAMLFLGTGAAGIYDLDVIPAARGRGIGSALAVACLRLARELGCDSTVLMSSGPAEGLYRRVGVQRVCTISHWYRSKAK